MTTITSSTAPPLSLAFLLGLIWTLRAQEASETSPAIKAEPVRVERVGWVPGDEVLHTRRIRGSAELTTERHGASPVTLHQTRQSEERRQIRVESAADGAVTRMLVTREGWSSTGMGEARPFRAEIPSERTVAEVANGALVVTDDEGERVDMPLLVVAIAGSLTPPLLRSLADVVPTGERLEPGRELEVPASLAARTITALGNVNVPGVWRDRDGALSFPTRRLTVLGSSLVDGVRCAAVAVELVRTRSDVPEAKIAVTGTLWIDVANGRPVRLDARLVATAERDDPSRNLTVRANADLTIYEVWAAAPR